MAAITDRILGLHGWVALLVVFAVPALESSAFLGFLFPGEIAVLLGGVLAFEHRISLPAALVAAVLGAVLGDSVGYEIGKRWGRAVLGKTVGHVVKREHLERAEHYLATKGGKAVFFGRFSAALRVLIPGLAGMSGLEYRSFLAYNAAGGVIWACGFVVLGYAAGGSWRSVEHVAKRASLVLGIVAVLVVAVVLAARWARHHQDELRGFARRQLDRPYIARQRERYSRQLGFLAKRLRPGGALGLSLTASLVGVGLLGWGFGTVVQDVLAGDDSARIDRPVLRVFARHREHWLTTAMRLVSGLGSAWLLIPLVLVAGGAWWLYKRDWRPGALLGVAYLGGFALYQTVKDLTQRARPPASLAVGHFGGFSFPSGHATESVAVWGMAAALLVWSHAAWPRKVEVWSGAVLIALMVGVSRVALGAHWPTDVLGGWALGGLWLGLLLAAARTLERLGRVGGGGTTRRSYAGR